MTKKYDGKIPMSQIDPPTLDIRRARNSVDIEELARSMKEVGLIEPIILVKKGSRYEIVAGRTRHQAAVYLGWTHINANVVVANDDQVLMMRVHENIHRRDISPLEEADVVGYMHYEMKRGIDVICGMLGKSESWVLDRIDMIHWTDQVKAWVHEGRVKIGVVKELMKVPDETIRAVLLDNAVRGGITIQTARNWRADYEAVQIPKTPEGQEAAQAGYLPSPASPHISCFLCGHDSPVGHTHAPNICGGCFHEILQQRSEKSIRPE